ncbi:uncharacterized protein [Diabrotica undecimpunctata]|uniref:uncharacterized protein n=1 Tax=Diabrotica undecimpunctata TaxID=50387 RepID=UPI003B632F32
MTTFTAELVAVKEAYKIFWHLSFHSCYQTQHIFGVGFVVSKRVNNLIIGFDAIDHRICVLRIRGTFFNYCLINAHAPTEDKTDTEKEEFYEKLEQTYRQCPNNDAKLIIGDMNAKVGQEEIDVDIARSSLRHGSDILDCRNYRGANIDSDHYLIAGRIRARISNARNDKTKPKIIKYNVDKLKCTEVERNFQICLDRKISEHPRSEVYPTELNTNWEFMKTTLKETAEEVLGKVPKRQRNNWFDEECQRVTKEKNDAYLKMINRRTRSNVEEYRIKRREEKQKHKQKKRQQINKEFEEMENLNREHEYRKFYKQVNIKKSFQATSEPSQGP